MPIYEYECSNCGKRFEKLQSITAEPLIVCIHCEGGPIRRLMHPAGIIFKGSGWYINDSRKSGGSDSSSSSSAKTDEGASKKDDKGTSAKADEGGKSESSSGKDASPSSE